MATKTKKTAVRAVVGSTKKSNSGNGINKRILLFAFVGFLAFSIAAGLGWQQWQDHQLQAHAKSNKTVLSLMGGQVVIKACITSSYAIQVTGVNSSKSTVSFMTITSKLKEKNLPPHKSGMIITTSTDDSLLVNVVTVAGTKKYTLGSGTFNWRTLGRC